MLLNPDNEYYHRTNDSVYDKFRATIRDKEAFNREIKQIKLTDQIKIWRTNKAIEDDCKQAMARREKLEREKRERVEYYICCGCCRRKKPKLTAEQKEKRKQAAWNQRVK